jgi:hypothetical protein
MADNPNNSHNACQASGEIQFSARLRLAARLREFGVTTESLNYPKFSKFRIAPLER